MKKVLIISALLLAGCQQAAQTHYILYMEKEDGVDPFQTRVFVSKDFLRFDDGEGSVNYVLMDRASKKIYSVNHENKTVMILQEKHSPATPPFELKYAVKKIGDMAEAPQINGKQPEHYQLSTNDQVCVDVVAVDGLMPEAVQAFKDFQMVLASDSATTIGNLPADMQDPCVMAMTTFAPTRHLEYGLPVQEWKPGYSRSMMDYKQAYPVDADTFVVPKDYFSYTVQEFRDGKVDMMNRKVLSEQ